MQRAAALRQHAGIQDLQGEPEGEYKIMTTYLKMKRAEWNVKAKCYGAIASLLEEQGDILELLQNLYAALKDVPAEELRGEFISRLTELIHEENKNKKE